MKRTLPCLRLLLLNVAGGGSNSELGVAPREIDFPYYSLKDGFHSTLMLVSDSPKPIDLTIGIRNLFGQMLTTTETIHPQQKLAIDLASTIEKLGQDPSGAFAEGSVAVYFVGTIMPVAGQMTVTNPALSLTHQVDMVENDPGRSDVPAVLNGAWWGLGGGNEAQVFVSNTSDTAEIAQVYLDFAGKRHALKTPLTFSSYETKVLDVSQLLASIGVGPAEAPTGGITIIQAGPHPALIASGKIIDPATGFSSTIDFPDPAVQRASALDAVGLPIGTPTKDSPFAHDGYFVPHVVVRNLLATPQMVTIAVEYPQPAPPGSESSPQSVSSAPPVAASGKPPMAIHRPPLPGDKDLHPEWGAGTGSTTGSTVVASFSVPAYSTVDYSLGPAMAELPLSLPFCSIRIQYSGAPGSVIADTSSVKAVSNMVVDAKAENEANGWAGSGANPWHLDKNTDSVLFLTDMGDKAARIGFELTAGGVHYYLTELKLEPHETRVVNIRALRDAQVAGFMGHKIPATATDGSINWVRVDDVPVMGRLMVISRKAGLSSSYDCSSCPCPASLSSLAMGPATTFFMLPGQDWWGTATANYETCNGTFDPVDVTDTSDWTSDDSAVAEVIASGEVQGVTGGVARITVQYFGFRSIYSGPPPGHCVKTSVEPSDTATCSVQTPTSLSIVAGTSSTGSESQCTTGAGTGCGVTRSFTYQVLDQNGNPITGPGIAALQFWDSFQVGSPNGLDVSGVGSTTCSPANTGPCGQYVNSQGQFAERALPVCSTVCYSKGTCVTAGYTSATQAIHIGPYTINQNISFYCDHVLVNGK